jgi:DnaJ-domain-containing protein 1
MNWNTGVMAGGTVLLALALGGVHGLVVMIALIISYWLLRSINIAGAAHHEKRSQERNAQQREAERQVEQERQSQQQQRREAEPECGSEKWRQRQGERGLNRFEENEWWSVLEVPPHASADQIRHAYRRKIKQCHPDRVVGLAPELLEWAESCTRTLNAAYSEANRARRSASAAR